MYRQTAWDSQWLLFCLLVLYSAHISLHWIKPLIFCLCVCVCVCVCLCIVVYACTTSSRCVDMHILFFLCITTFLDSMYTHGLNLQRYRASSHRLVAWQIFCIMSSSSSVNANQILPSTDAIRDAYCALRRACSPSRPVLLSLCCFFLLLLSPCLRMMHTILQKWWLVHESIFILQRLGNLISLIAGSTTAWLERDPNVCTGIFRNGRTCNAPPFAKNS